MKGYYVYDIYQANEIEEWNINAEGCIAGTVRLKSYECLFYCESRTNGGVMFGCEGKKVLDKVFREARAHQIQRLRETVNVCQQKYRL